MQKLILLVFFLMSCTQRHYVDGQSLYDNESLVYDNYQHSYLAQEQLQKDTLNVKAVQSAPKFEEGSNSISRKLSKKDITCTNNCDRHSLRVAIAPMSFDDEVILREIKQTVALLGTQKQSEGAYIKMLDGDGSDVRSYIIQLISFGPNVIVGPFSESDTKSLYQYLMQFDLNIPIVSLTNIKSSKEGLNGVSYFGYKVEDDVKSLINTLDNEYGYKNYAMIAPNSKIGSYNYNLFKKHTSINDRKMFRTEFYDADSLNMVKHIQRLKSSLFQVYYENVDNGKISEDSRAFTKKIESTDGDIVTLKNGDKYYKKKSKLDAIIIDALSDNFLNILQEFARNNAFNDTVLIGSSRTTDAIIQTMYNNIGVYRLIDKPFLMASNFKFYQMFYNAYTEQFGTNPTRISTTLYETLVYVIKLHHEGGLRNGNIYLQEMPEFVGLNGRIIIPRGSNMVFRHIPVSQLLNGEISTLDH